MELVEQVVDSIVLQPHSVLGGRLQLLIPEGFVPMSEEMRTTKYPNENRPAIVFTNEPGTINIAVNHSPDSVFPDKLKELHHQLDFSIRQSIPDATWRFSGFQHYQGREWIQMEFISPARDTNIRNIMVATSLDNRMLAVSFNVTEDLAADWLNAGRAVIKSLVVN